jgi:hypothetical protein
VRASLWMVCAFASLFRNYHTGINALYLHALTTYT